MVETRDVLIKAAEDVQQGMWCKGSWFAESLDHRGRSIRNSWLDDQLFAGVITAEHAQKTHRCAEGSIALATALLGGGEREYANAVDAVEATLEDRLGESVSLWGYNDCRLPDDSFEASQMLAELFRTTAESL